jgi:hypothetical protein
VAADDANLNRLQQRALVIGGLGLAAGLIGAFTDRSPGEAIFGLSPQFFRSWLIGFLFCLGLSVGSLGWLMLQHLSGGQWGMVSRRVFEAATRTLPVIALFFLPVILGLGAIFEWSHPDATNDAIIRAKSPYLNTQFFLIRALVYFVFWAVTSWLLTSWSYAQDQGQVGTTAEDMVRFRKVSAPGLLFLVMTVTFASVDWVMSLEPEWYSTIFGLLTVVGQGLNALAMAIIVLKLLAEDRQFAGKLKPKHFHDLGKLLLAFVMLWAYLSFSQFLIIWSGNLPEEIPWYLKRMQGTWGFIAIALIVGHFFLPFLLLLSRNIKRHPGLLSKVAVVVIIMRLVDLIWLVQPSFEHHGFPISWMDIAIPVGMAGLWTFVFARNLGSRSLLPVNDPYVKEALLHEAH